MSVLLLELNEVNFDYVRRYAADGLLPMLGAMIDRHGVIETTSEQHYDELEPWIQWVTAHTGLSLGEHGVFRLGDIVDHDIEQIWEVLERQGVTVGAISPMNAKNRCANAAFFMPDPWTTSTISGSKYLERLYAPVAQAVNDNATGRMTARSVAQLMVGFARFARVTNYARYGGLVGQALRRRPWAKPMVLDQLLADVFIDQVKATRPGFASLFLNAAAHIQHHYLFNSSLYAGEHANPAWYVDGAADPVLEVYRLYDSIVAQVRDAFPAARIMLATGLHQDPHADLTFHWRLRDHQAFLAALEVPHDRVETRMARDFVVYCRDPKQAAVAEERLAKVVAPDGTALFEIDNRGGSLFVMITWPNDIPDDFTPTIDGRVLPGFRDMVTFVAIKNGEHNGTGYLVDSAVTLGDEASPIALADLPARIATACGARWPAKVTGSSKTAVPQAVG